MHLELTKQHLSTKIFRSYLWYLRKNYPQIALDEICLKAGLPLSHIENEHNWVSVLFDYKFTTLCIEATGDKDLCFKVGLCGVSEELVGPILYGLVKHSMSTETVYDSLPKMTLVFSRVMKISTSKKILGERTINLALNLDKLTQEEKHALQSNLPNILRNTEGYWAAVPTVFGQPLAKSAINITRDGDGIENYQLNFKYSPYQTTKLRLALTYVLGALFFFFVTKLLPNNNFIVSTLGLSTVLILLAIRYYKVKKALAQSDQSLQRLDDQYLVLQNTKESLQRRYQEASLQHILSENLTKARSKSEIIEQSSEDIIKTLRYDRVLILLADHKSNKLVYGHSKGPDKKLLSAFKQFSLPLKISSTDPKKVTNVYQTGEPFLIDDVRKHLPTLNEESRRALLLTGSRSFLCVAINSETAKHGILCVDYQTRSKKLTTDDLEVMRSVGRQIALVLDKEDAIENSIVALKKADKIKDEFLANTSHELRTPLHGIIGLTESLIDGAKGKLPSDTVSNLKMIVSSGKRLASLVDDILDFSKLKNEPIVLNFKPINVKDMADLIFALLATTVKGKNVKLVNHVAKEASNVIADENRLQQILINLIGNAIKFTKEGEVKLETTLKGDFVEFKISDTGRGISKDSLNLIFEAFKQEDGSDSREYGGTGLGLSITKSLIENHGGRIWVESTLGVGSQFYFTLKNSTEIALRQTSTQPVAPATTLLEETTTLIEQQNISAAQTGYKILIVDDESINRQVLYNYLAPQGYQCIEAGSGQEALQKIEAGLKPDVVLLDVMMPGMTGFETCKKMRLVLPATSIPILFLTAKNQITDIVQGLSVGANDYLTKPFSKEELLARIANHLGLAKTVASYCRFVPFEFINLLKKETILQIGLGDNVEREMSVMFIDIRDFTRYSESHSPLEIFRALNRFFACIAPEVRKHQGFIDKYTGDGLMAIFPLSFSDAVNAAANIVKGLRVFNFEEQKKGQPGIKTGIGINTGNLILGAIGYEEQMQGTVISDAVNIASRLESLTKDFGVNILVPEELTSTLSESEKHWRRLGEVSIKGKSQTIRIVEVFSGDPEGQITKKLNSRSDFEKAVRLFSEGDFESARPLFEAILNDNPLDSCANYFLSQLNAANLPELKRAA